MRIKKASSPLYDQFFKLIISICLCLIIAAIGGIFSENVGPEWYPPMTNPLWIMPKWMTSTIWCVIYILMGIALGLVWISPTKNKDHAYYAFFAQLFLTAVLNFIWSRMFFYLDNPLLNLFNIFFLLLMIALTLSLFYDHSRLAAYLLVPYTLWIIFAMIRNLYLGYS